ncbi:hypothetical protein EK21DRAFT_105547 [Setomelanomma holmii]|uniref:Uncharacterized protein n=1 Tax=Setomelanomma holmii TaxID=210430 RepID=A0A9P4GXG7_9PLEO|nr:hypothetical protein EK21DRAFT_105547 [Setomelanomma holmii]
MYTPFAGAIRLSGLTADDRESYRWECDRWERRRSEYRTHKTIAARHKHLMKDHETPYDRLVALKKFLCPPDATRLRELADKYNTLKTAPRAAKKVEQWLTDWVYITAHGKSIKLPETDGNRTQEDSRGSTGETSSLETYVAEMTTYLRRTKPPSTGLAQKSRSRL